MWRRGRRQTEVTCIACGGSVPRAEAREYDKHGDRFDRSDKDFEHLCKPCFRDLCHQPREELESLLLDLGAGEGIPREVFLEKYTDAVDDRNSGRNQR